MSLVDNERTKLLANALDRASTACFTVGILTPTAGYFYGFLNFPTVIDAIWLLTTAAGWPCGYGCTTFGWKTHSCEA